ncbi:MAG: hypothetical protein ACTMII_05335 [Brachybacterium sp.]
MAFGVFSDGSDEGDNDAEGDADADADSDAAEHPTVDSPSTACASDADPGSRLFRPG